MNARSKRTQCERHRNVRPPPGEMKLLAVDALAFQATVAFGGVAPDHGGVAPDHIAPDHGKRCDRRRRA